MLPDRVSNPGPLTYESGALLIALRGPAGILGDETYNFCVIPFYSNDKHSNHAILNKFKWGSKRPKSIPGPSCSKHR